MNDLQALLKSVARMSEAVDTAKFLASVAQAALCVRTPGADDRTADIADDLRRVLFEKTGFVEGGPLTGESMLTMLAVTAFLYGICCQQMIQCLSRSSQQSTETMNDAPANAN